MSSRRASAAETICDTEARTCSGVSAGGRLAYRGKSHACVGFTYPLLFHGGLLPSVRGERGRDAGETGGCGTLQALRARPTRGRGGVLGASLGGVGALMLPTVQKSRPGGGER